MTGDDAPPLPTRPHINLYDMTPDQRETYYKLLFSKKVEPLAYIAVPDECEEYPEFESEIITAYLTWTTFSVKVWTNYDAAAQRFYIDGRINDCGKLLFKPGERERLNQADPNARLQVTRVRFEIGTPFTPLCNIKLIAAPVRENGEVVGAEIRAKMGDSDAAHLTAVNFVTNRCNQLDSTDLAGGNAGFLVSDLEEVAGHFRREPTQAHVSKMRYSSDPSPWMNFEDER